MSSPLARQCFVSMLVAACAAVAGGCASTSPSSQSARLEPPGRDAPVALPLSGDEAEWNRGVLQCPRVPTADACGNWYLLSVPETGAIRIEVRAPVGPEVPDFDVRLEDRAGDVLWGFAPTGTSPRQIDRILDPGDYWLLIESVGERRGPLAYEVVAQLDGLGPVVGGAAPPRQVVSAPPRPAVSAPPRPIVSAPPTAVSAPPTELKTITRSVASLPRVASAPPVPEAWISGVVLEVAPVEGSSGSAKSVVLDVGSRDSLRAGLRGELLVHGDVIATFEVLEVEEQRSRARLDDPPPPAIPSGARARVRVPVH